MRRGAEIMTFGAKTLRRYNRARAEICKAGEVIWLSSGNHATNGQVIIGNTGDRQQVLHSLENAQHSGTIRYLPHAGLVFPELLQPEPVPELQPNLSCAERVTQGTQHLLVNDFQAMVVAQYLYRLLHQEPVTTFMSFVGSSDMVIHHTPIEAATLLPYLAA